MGGPSWTSRVNSGLPRVLRGAGLAACCAALGAAGHAIAGGQLPEPGPTLLLTVLLAGVGIALADRQRGLPSIVATVGATQVGLHVLLDALAHGQSGSHLPPSVPAPVDPVAMSAVHVVATLLTALLLAGAERSVFALAGVLGWLLRGVPVRPLTILASGPPRAVPPAEPAHRELSLLLRSVHGRRGPPVAL
jgi:hypothetical protein